MARYVENGVVAHLDPSGLEVWIGCRDIDMYGWPGSHQYLIIIPENPKDFPIKQLRTYGLGVIFTRDLPNGKRYFTIGAFPIVEDGVRRLKPIANAEADVKATDEELNPRPHWLPGFSMERVKLPPVVDGKPVSDTVFIRHLLRRTANYIANEREHFVEYRVPSQSCNTWLNSLLISIGAQVPDKDWFGPDLGHDYQLPPEYFDPPKSAK